MIDFVHYVVWPVLPWRGYNFGLTALPLTVRVLPPMSPNGSLALRFFLGVEEAYGICHLHMSMFVENGQARLCSFHLLRFCVCDTTQQPKNSSAL